MGLSKWLASRVDGNANYSVADDGSAETDYINETELERYKHHDEATDDTEQVINRDQWGNKMDFVLSCLGYAIGLGNVWRFPYMCYSNGGGVFVLVYILLLGVCALPIMVLEMLFGQFSNLGCISVWRISPLFKGIGFGMALISAYFCLYYNIVIAYTIYFLVASFKNPLPWSHCGNAWNTVDCFMYQSTEENSTDDAPVTATAADGNGTRRVWASEEFWERKVLGMTDGLHDIGGIRWELLGCFWLVWIIVYLCIIRGVKTSGKVVYFTALFPFVVLIILLIRGLTLEGAGAGILYYIRPQFGMLLNAKVWAAAANQVFYSFGAGWGGVMTLASYNNYRNNSIKDCCVLVLMGSAASVMAGFVVFSVLGYMAESAGLDIEDVVRAGPGLTFIVYPMALSRLPLPQFWSVVFFFMLFTLGLDSQFVTLETVITALVDEISDTHPWVQRKRYFVIFGVCVIMAIVGIPLCTQGGIYLETLIDWYSAGFSPLLMALIEITVICHVYGWRRFRTDISTMLGFVPSMYWIVSWLVVSPLVMLVVFVYTFVDYQPPSLGDYAFTTAAQVVGWVLMMTSIMCIFIYAFYNVYFIQAGTLIERVKAASRPLPEWGPKLNEHRIEAGFQPLPGHGAKDRDGSMNSSV